MKHFYLVYILIIIFVQNGIAQKSVPATETAVNGPIIKWDKANHDFGDIAQGDRVEATFTFTNTGNEPLIITNVAVTCGCTTPKGWPKDPILPGGKNEITVAFNSAGRYGQQNKVVKVISNATGDQNEVSFRANVLKDKDQ